MIQRIQSIWLLLAGIAGLMTYRLPLWSGSLADTTIRNFTGAESLLLFALIILTCILAFVTIFLYKNRKSQKNFALLGMLLSIAIIALEYFKVEDYKKGLLNIATGSWQFGALMPVLMVIFFFLAYQGIRSDEKMIKSLERLR
jgi:peptidoglycan/LPS O-acetylase OafA/YrhL